MLRPDQMSKVSVTGSKGVMPSVIETIHELNLVHLSDYDGSWADFDNGNPIEGAEEASEKLVTVRALESTLGLDPEEAEPSGRLDDEWEARLEGIRTRVNELDDQRGEVREQLRLVSERLDRVEPFAELGIDLDLLTGYDTVEVLVGSGSLATAEEALSESDEIRAYETFTGGDVVAIVAAPADGATGVIDDALVGIEFSRYELPDTDRSPDVYAEELAQKRRELEAEIDDIDAKLGRVRIDEGGFLLRLEEELTIEVQRAEAPLQFATSQRAFVAEGWIPSEHYDDLVAALTDAVGESVEIEELERADYDRHGAPTHAAPVPHEGGPAVDTDEEDADAEADADAQKAATDGGTSGGSNGKHAAGASAGAGGAVTMDDEPPTVLDNIDPARPFELMVKMVSQPKYSELDPTLLVFLTFPFAFGFMIGDIGYGILYMAMGWGCWKIFDSDAGKAIGTIGIWAGAFTVLFGYLYDDLFGMHMEYLGLGWLPLAGSLNKGLQLTDWAVLWMVLAIGFGLIHLNIGLILGFVNELSHGLKAAIYEKGSWILAMNGLFIWIFSTHMIEYKPEFLVGTSSETVLYAGPYNLGFEGLPEVVGILGLVALGIGVVLVGIGEGVAGLFETPAWAFGHVLSYLRMVAVLLAKGGMAFAVNLLVFGAYSNEEGYTVFNLPTYDVGAYETQEFVGLVHADPLWITIPLAIFVFVFGHILVLLLGITAAGIQMLRLEYVEFFQKFYEGGGEEYEPFGKERTHTAD
ncbi:V-type ATP synthase subunit I [Natronobiforma cellulositropha]|uniref:V-type ATP synthase subunit I n=1 Tax=Natronobiforma cellulositropha TaxID=1679076 RepID=UPI0021D5C373|nr:V-type ATP synthase subunit I [Natronobiforma cellulositropha]